MDVLAICSLNKKPISEEKELPILGQLIVVGMCTHLCVPSPLK